MFTGLARGIASFRATKFEKVKQFNNKGAPISDLHG